MKNNIHVELYTDGATRANGTDKARGGWAYVFNGTFGNKTGYGGELNTTNNRMELTAIINGIGAALDYYKNYEVDMCIYSDSAYVINCYKEGWYKNWQKNGWINSARKPVANQDLWEILIPYFENKKFEFYKVKGHAGNPNNELVDKLACKGADELNENILY